MKYKHRLLAAAASAALSLGCLGTSSFVLAAAPEYQMPADMPNTSRDDASDDVKKAVSRAVYSFGNSDSDGVAAALEEIQSLSPDEWYPIYNQLFAYWDYIETEMDDTKSIADDGLEDPAHHCFIVLGFALADDGTMKPELVGRLETALACLEKYPESKVLVTGGVEKNGWTEGDRMHDWLVENGIDESRIYVENKAPDTAGNAKNSMQIIYGENEDYGETDIKTVSLISSQYHLKRGTILYYTESLLRAKELSVEPVEFLADFDCGWYREDKTSEPLNLKVMSEYSILRVPMLSSPRLSGELYGLDLIDKQSRNFVRAVCDPLDMEVKTLDEKGENVTVTDFCTIRGYDNSVPGIQTVSVTFTLNGVTVSQTATVYVVEDKGDIDLYRVYNPNTGEHLFTSDENEAQWLSSHGWNDEGSGWCCESYGETPVWRVYNPNNGEHHYTQDLNEKTWLCENGWNDEGVAWFTQDGGTPVYRLFNPNVTVGTHHYTADENEYQYLAGAGWVQEGLSFYALTIGVH